MIKRRLVIFAIMFITILALSTASAGAFGEWWNKITGKVTTAETCIDSDGKDNFLVSGYVDLDGTILSDYCEAGGNHVAYDYYCNLTGSVGFPGDAAVINNPDAPTTARNCFFTYNMRCLQGRCVCFEGQTRSCSGSTVGECNPGTETCDANGNWDGICNDFQGVENEVCGDGKDSDCDGVADENDPNADARCESVWGSDYECANQGGTVDCYEKIIVECSMGDTQLCNLQQGVCVGSQQVCDSSGNWPGCDYTTISNYEINEVSCDGLNNDCDGETDEGGVCIGVTCTNGHTKTCEGNNVGECFAGTETCVDGSWDGSCLNPIGPTTETCDTKDNDCDSYVDEDESGIEGGICDTCTGTESQVCSGQNQGACTPGTKTCSGGSWEICVGFVGPGTETCNGIDDNCNSFVDKDEFGEDLKESCGTNVGECVQGTKTCGSGSWGSCGGDYIGPTEEICDGKDNDCDGVADEGCECPEGTTRPCGKDVGECTKGTQVCTNKEWGTICLNSQGESTETCDQKDNDCDGLVDEGNACDDNSIVNLKLTNAASCEDTDDKDDIYTKGEVTGKTSAGDAISFEDECLNTKQVAQYSCFRDPDTNDLFLQQKGYNCPSNFFCEDGICKTSASKGSGTTSTKCIGSDTTLPLSIGKVCFNKNTRDVQITLSKDNSLTIDYLDFFITDNERDVSILTCGNTCGGCEVIDSGTKSYYIYIENKKKTPTSLILKSTNCLTDITQIKTC